MEEESALIRASVMRPSAARGRAFKGGIGERARGHDVASRRASDAFCVRYYLTNALFRSVTTGCHTALFASM